MERMESSPSLRDRIARTLIRAEGFDPDDGEGLDAWMNHAELVLHELGLDEDANEKIARALARNNEEEHLWAGYRDAADAVLAALTPTKGGQDGD